MTLEVIGSGLGRTGTKSLQSALNMLGFGPCYHMVEVFQDRDRRMPQWIEAGRGNPNWEAIFDGYRSTVDYPGAAYWRELADYYPQAKVIHTVRDPEVWFDSTQATIFRPDGFAMSGLAGGGMVGDFFASFVRASVGDHLHDREWMIDAFERHTEEVKATIAPDRLLIYRAGDGWKPLCDFLGVPVPEESYPLENTRAEFVARQTTPPLPQGS
jgi:hypothetical protein